MLHPLLELFNQSSNRKSWARKCLSYLLNKQNNITKKHVDPILLLKSKVECEQFNEKECGKQ